MKVRAFVFLKKKKKKKGKYFDSGILYPLDIDDKLPPPP